MKKKLYRMMSALCALVLMVQTMAVTTGFAAVTYNIPVAGNIGAKGTSNVQDVFYYTLNTMPTTDSTDAITDFEPLLDWLVISLPTGVTSVVEVNGTGSKISAQSTNSPSTKNMALSVNVLPKDVTPRIIGKTAPIVRDITIGKPNDDNTILLTGIVNSFDGTAVAATATYQWAKNGVPITGATATTLNVTEVGKANYTLTATNLDGATAVTVNITVAPPPVCTAKLTGVQVTASDIVGGKVSIQSPITKKQFAASYAFDKSADNCGGLHKNSATKANHDKTVTFVWSISPDVAGVSIDANGELTIDRSILPVGECNINVSAVGTVVDTQRKVADSTATGGFALTISNSESCSYTIGGLTIVSAPTAINADVTQSVTYAATVGYTGAVACTSSNANHKAGIHTTPTWSIRVKDAGSTLNGLALDAATGVLTINRAAITKPKSEIIITATAGGFAIDTAVTVTKTLDCTLGLKIPAINNIGAVAPGAVSPVTSTLIYEAANNRFIFAAVDSNPTLQFSLGAGKPVYEGICGYENTGVVCPKIDNHRVKWSLAELPVDAVGSVSIDTSTGLLTVHRDYLPRKQVSVKVVATVGTTVTGGYIVINKGAYVSPTPPPTDNDDDHDYEEQKRQEQYDKIEDQIAYAERKDTIKANLSANPKLPTRIMRDLRGQDINLELYMGDGFTWRVNGKNLKPMPQYQIYIAFDVKKIRDGDISEKAKDHDIEILELGHDGDMFGTYRLETRLGSDYAKKTVYLYKHLDNSSRLSYKGAAKVDEDGFVVFPFTSASTYVITDRALYGETVNTVPSGGTSGGTTGGASGTVKPTAPPASAAPTAPTAPPSSAISSSSSESSSAAESIAPPSSEEQSKPADAEPEEKPEPEKKKSKIPIIVPILLVVVTITIVAVILLTKGGGMDIGG